MMFGSMCVSVRSSGCVRNLQKNIYSEHTDKKYSPHLEQNISLPFSFPLPVKYCKIIQAGVSKLILSRLHTTGWQSNLIMSMMVVNSANLQHLFKCRKIMYEFSKEIIITYSTLQWDQNVMLVRTSLAGYTAGCTFFGGDSSRELNKQSPRQFCELPILFNGQK